MFVDMWNSNYDTHLSKKKNKKNPTILCAQNMDSIGWDSN